MARDRDTGIVKPTPVIFDEQAKAAAMRAATAAAPAAAAQIAKTPEELMIDRINAQIAKTQESVASLQTYATELGALNPSVMTKATGETNSEFLARKRAAEDLARQNEMAENPLLNKAVKPTGAPAGKYYAWIGGTNTGSWQLYDIPGYGTSTSGSPDVVSTVDNVNGANPARPVGTPPAYVYDAATKTWVQPPKPTGAGNWKFDANNGWVDTTVEPGSSGKSTGSDKTLALDTFKNTLALLFGAKEASQPWVTALYGVASKFYNTGSTVDEALNLSLQDIRFNKDLKPFTDRFNGIYALTDRLAGGEAIEVPTIAEYFKSESAMGDVLRAAGMGDLANQNFLGGIIGLGKSVLEVTNLITDTFERIDNAPSALKADLQAYFPGADRTSIAKALLLGEKGAAELTKKVKAISVQSAAKTQGVNINDLTSEDIAAQGYDYGASLTGFATVKQLERGQDLGRMSGIDLTQQEAVASTFQANAAAAEKIRKIKEEEANRFSGSSGRFASKDRAQSII